MVLAACSRQKTASTGEGYLALAAKAPATQKTEYEIKAADQFLSQQQPQKAAAVLATLHQTALSPTQRGTTGLIEARTLLINGQVTQAIQALNALTPQTTHLTTTQQIQRHTLLANAYETAGNTAASIVEHNILQQLLTDPKTQHENLMATWQSLQSLSSNQLNALLNQSPSPTLRGWVTLALLSKSSNSPAENAAAIAQWQSNYPTHPAMALFPKTKTTTNTQIRPQVIALLLPLHGQLAETGQAIRNGFLAAYYHDKQQDPLNNTEIKLYDTSTADINTRYKQAVAEGATRIIGPLLKKRLRDLVDNSDITIPTIALNTLPDYQNSLPNLYQFGLSPIDETEQATTHALQKGYRHAMLIASDANWSQQIAQPFLTQWQAGDGQITLQLNYHSTQNLSNTIATALGISLATQDFKKLHALLGDKIRYLPRRRQDIDFIYLIAQPAVARQIMPLLRFYYAGDLPVYSTAQVYPGHLSRRAKRDMNGIAFYDMPWVLTPNQLSLGLQKIRQQIETVWPMSFSRHPKLYALGIDAYQLTTQLPTLQSHTAIQGATGKLSLSDNQHIYRQLQWSQLSHGKPQPLG